MKRLLCLLGILLLCSCSDPAGVVKDAKMARYPDRTIGQAMEQSFSNGVWKSAAHPGGGRDVIFVGIITNATHHRAVKDFLAKAAQNPAAFTLPDGVAALKGEELAAALAKLTDDYWPAGSPVELIWSDAAGDGTYILKHMENASWSAFGLTQDMILQVIFAR
ncbi:exported hypothetical protein [uncultured delta proteobacterium]|uniref:Lipoprotein n=1 Tax=uncultured delta proteobacterium TaxID=34034 RepID=A0A212K0T3_9DELT|nr:exported hypothetical protein [uncultured delta proteobacterium]